MIGCPTCGYPNDESEYRCERCGRRFDAPPLAELGALALWPETEEEAEQEQTTASAEPPPPAPVRTTAPPAPARTAAAGADLWREEVSSRLERFRERRRAQGILPLDFDEAGERASAAPRPALDRSRKVIPFEEIAGGRVVAPEPPPVPPRQPPPRPQPSAPPPPEPTSGLPSSRTQRPRIRGASTPQASFVFPEPSPLPVETVEFPVAPLAARVMAGAADAALLAFGYAVFFGFYTFLGGEFPLHRLALAALAGSLAVLAFLYNFLFLYFSEATPGMRWMGLRLVDFDGAPARRHRRVLRLLGLMASGAAMGVGFLWAAVDEQGLTWHDRISRTCLASGDPLPRRRPPRT